MPGRGRKARKRLSPEQRREEILGAAHRVFVAQDPAAVTFEEIAAEAGVSRALVYNYFGDKGSLLAAVYSYALTDLDAELLADLRAERTLDDRLRAVVCHYVAFAQAHTGTWQLLGHVAATQHSAVRAARRARVDALATALGGTAALRLALAGLLGMLEGALWQWLEQPEIGLDELLAGLEQLAWSGIGGVLSPPVNEFAT